MRGGVISESKHVPIEQTTVFALFEECASWAWLAVSEWNQFEKDTIGRQLVRSIDSINANLAEGDGRHGVADGLHYFVIARGSVRESILWIRRAIERSIVSEIVASEQLAKLQEGLRQLNLLINYRRSQGKFVREEQSLYIASGEE